MKEIAVITEEGVYSPNTPAPAGEYASHRTAVRCLLFDKEGKLAFEYWNQKIDHDEGWSVPGGGIDEGEDEITALRREMLEETGCEIENIKELGTIMEYYLKRSLIHVNHCYTAIVSGDKGIPQTLEKDRANGQEVRWLSIDEAIPKISPEVVTRTKSPLYKESTVIERRRTFFLLNLAKKLSI